VSETPGLADIYGEPPFQSKFQLLIDGIEFAIVDNPQLNLFLKSF